ncbi:MAG: adenine phosphoribosyltransferase [Anaerolineae bacterium]
MDLASLIREIPDFPVKGVRFKDITPLLANPYALREAVDSLAQPFLDQRIDKVVAVEARGFVFGAPVAYRLCAGFIPVRKPGKLPAAAMSTEYSLEYGVNTLQIHADAIAPDERVLIVDDLLATGGSARATIELVERLGGYVVGVAFLVELEFLEGMKKLEGYDVFSLIKF